MSLTSSQREAMTYLRAIPAKFGIVQGPPGTGKTYTAVETIMPLLVNHSKILVVSAANKPVDEFACKLIERVKQEGLSDTIVIRLHAAETETSIVFQDAGKNKPRSTPPRIDQDLALAEIGTMITSQFIHDHVNRSIATGPTRDPRVTLLDHSMGMWMLRFAGFVPSKWAEPDARPSFRLNYSHFQHGDHNTRVEDAAMNLKQVSAVHRHLITEAHPSTTGHQRNSETHPKQDPGRCGHHDGSIGGRSVRQFQPRRHPY